MRPNDLDDLSPLEPDDVLLSRVRARSVSFRRRRRGQRLVTGATGLVVLALAVGFAVTRVSASNGRETGPSRLSTSTTVAPTTTTPGPLTTSQLIGMWRPISIPGYDGPLTDPPLGEAAFLRFQSATTWGGSDGCNGYGGTYRLGTDGSFHSSGLSSTAVLCRLTVPTPASLTAATRIELTNGRLTFFASSGRVLAQFARAEISAQIVLQSSTINAGSTMAAHVVVQNDTRNVMVATKCGQIFQVVLVKPGARPAVTEPRCDGAVEIPLGESTYPVTIDADALPPGDYQATLIEGNDVIPIPPRVTVHVVSSLPASANP